jgi:outer membrane protein TolC
MNLDVTAAGLADSIAVVASFLVSVALVAHHSSGAAQEASIELPEVVEAKREILPARPPPPTPGRSETLTALLQRVLPYDPQVRLAKLSLEVASERRTQARSRLGPSLGLGVTYGRAAEQDFGAQIDRRTDRSEASLRWNLYNYGNDAAEWRASSIDETAAAQDVRRVQEEVAQRIAETYLEVLRLQDLLAVSGQRLESVQGLLQLAKRQNELGKLSDADILEAESAVLDAQLAHQSLVSDLDSARLKLAALAGAASPSELGPVAPFSLRRPTMMGDGAVSESANATGAAQAAQQRALAGRERVRPSESLLAPRIDLELRKQLSNRTTPRNSTEQQQTWLLTARWDFPLGGELQSRRTETERRAEIAEAEAMRIARNVGAERSVVGVQIVNAEQAIEQLQKQIAQYGALMRAGDLQYDAGRKSLSQLIQLRESQYAVELRKSEQLGRLRRAQLSDLALSGELLSALGVIDFSSATQPK